MSLWSNNKLMGADNVFVLQASSASLVLVLVWRRRAVLSGSDRPLQPRGGVVALIHPQNKIKTLREVKYSLNKHSDWCLCLKFTLWLSGRERQSVRINCWGITSWLFSYVVVTLVGRLRRASGRLHEHKKNWRNYFFGIPIRLCP